MAEKNILIVEDEYINALDLKTQLMLKGYSGFEIVVTGEEAVQRAHFVRFDIIFMDIQLMGEINGIDAAKQIKEKQDVAIVFLSGDFDVLLTNRMKKIKPAGMLRKPFYEHELDGILEKVFPLN